MFKRATVVLLSILTCCALICVGFSSWSIVAEDTDVSGTSNGSINSEDVIYSDDYVKIDEAQLEGLNKKTFVVSPYGFVITDADGNQSIETKGTLQIPLIINMENCYAFSASAVQVNITVSLEKESNLLTATQFMSLSCEDGSVKDIQGTGLNSTKEYLISFSLETANTTEPKQLTIDLVFDFRALNNYSYYLYNQQFVDNSEIINSFIFAIAVSNGN